MTPKQPAPSKAPEPKPSTSKATVAVAAAKGRKRLGKSDDAPEVPTKVVRTVEKIEPVKESAVAKAVDSKVKTPVKAKLLKKSCKETR